MAKKATKTAAKKPAKKWVVAIDRLHLDDGTLLYHDQPVPHSKQHEASGWIKHA